MQIQPQHLRFNLLIFALLGVLLGILILFSSAPTFVLALIFLIFLFLRYSNRQDGRFISLLFIAGIVSRILVAYFLHLFLTYYGFFGADLFGDAGANTLRGWDLAQFWSGNMAHYYKAVVSEYNKHGWAYFAGFFYTFFGYSALGLKFINCLLSTLTGIMVYFTAKEIFSVKVARTACVLVVFFPSMFLWSLTNLKESGVIFLITAVIWSFILFVKTKKLYYLVFLILAVCFLHPLRKQLGVCIGLIALFSYFCFCISKLSVAKTIGICLIALIILQIFLSANNTSLKSVASEGLVIIISTHRGAMTSGGSRYKLLDEKYYFGSAKDVVANMSLLDYAKFLFRAWGHFLFEPLPWKIHTKQMLASYPQMVLWYALTPFALLGILLAFRYNWRLSLILFVHLFIIGSLFAMLGGNIGTNLRHRDQITPVFLVFASVGLVKICARDFNQDLKK